MDAIKQRFLADRVMTATPAQRVVMLYDRLVLDFARARTETANTDRHLDHAAQIIAELRGTLDVTAGGPADNLAMIYDYWLREIMTGQLTGDTPALDTIEADARTLREAWVTIASASTTTPAGTVSAALRAPALAGASWTA